jgi:hypothetical protein
MAMEALSWHIRGQSWDQSTREDHASPSLSVEEVTKPSEQLKS